jgi:hypothetical protein
MFPLLLFSAGAWAFDGGVAISAAQVRAHMEFLASDALNGRGSGSRDEWIAASYAAAEFTRDGLKPLSADGFLEPVELERQEAVGEIALKVGSLRLIQGKDMLVRALSSASIAGTVERFQTGSRAAHGAVLLMPPDLAQIPEEAQDAALLLFRESRDVRAHWQDLATRSVYVGAVHIAGLPKSHETASSRLILSASSYDEVAKLSHPAVSLAVQTEPKLGHTWNAAARLPGTAANADDKIVLLTAHLDHLGTRDSGADRIYNGADDDASGCTAVLTLAAALSHGAPLKRSVVFVLFGSEEVGGYGARYFVDKPVLPLASIAVNLEFEMIGRPDPAVAPGTLWLTGWDRSNLGPTLAQHGAHLVADPHPEQNFFARSDNITLARRGVVAQTISSFGLHSDYHQPSDEVSRIDFSHLTQSIGSFLEPIRWLADGNFTPSWAPGRQP